MQDGNSGAGGDLKRVVMAQTSVVSPIRSRETKSTKEQRGRFPYRWPNLEVCAAACAVSGLRDGRSPESSAAPMAVRDDARAAKHHQNEAQPTPPQDSAA